MHLIWKKKEGKHNAKSNNNNMYSGFKARTKANVRLAVASLKQHNNAKANLIKPRHQKKETPNVRTSAKINS